jgi:hypothetical protein
MKFLLINADPHVLSLARAIEQDEKHEITQRADIADLATAAGDYDAAVVGFQTDPAKLLSAIRLLVAERKPVVLSHPVNLSVMVHYEIEMLAADADAVVITTWPLRNHPAFDETLGSDGHGAAASGQGTSSAAGRQITVSRLTREQSQEGILRLFAQDMAGLRPFVGDLTSLVGLCPSGNGKVTLPINVQMTSTGGTLVQWSAAPAADDSAETMTIDGVLGGAVLVLSPATSPPAVPETGGRKVYEYDAAAAASIDALVKELGCGGFDHRGWETVTRSLELAEALEKSVRKGRLVQLSYESRGEVSAFKGTMASAGCALLVAAPLLLLVAAGLVWLARQQGWMRLAAALQWLPHGLLLLLVGFLLIQLLRFLIPSTKEGD